jgi:hypothetical protein
MSIFSKKLVSSILFFTAVSGVFCYAGLDLDRTRYIGIDEITPGMKAYCKTTYQGTKIEEFELEVISVVLNMSPGRNAILVKGLDPRFVHTGPVAGCSGSPVYIDGRLAGALAFGWTFSKDALYGVTPIEEMLMVGKGIKSQQTQSPVGFSIDYTKPIDLVQVYSQLDDLGPPNKLSLSGASVLPSPLITSALPVEAENYLEKICPSLGMIPVAGIGGNAAGPQDQDVKLEPGSSLALPLVSGDITMTGMGTVTETVGDKVYGFGHSFLGYGAVDVPMATGHIHTVVSSLSRSFKMGSAIKTVGALTVDEAAAVFGRIGAVAKTIPISVSVERYNDIQRRVYNCRIVNNRMITPGLLPAVISGASLMAGSLPPDHTIQYNVSIDIEGFEPITFENISTGSSIGQVLSESVGTIMLLMTNPFKKVDIESVDFDIKITDTSISSHIWSVDISDSKVKPGEKITVSTIIESVLADKKKYEYELKIPENIPAGKYNLMITGVAGYSDFIRKATPYKFMYHNLQTLVQGLKNVLAMKRDRLYCILTLPSGGIALEGAELPDLPATKMLVLGDAKRTLDILPYHHWVEKIFETNTVVVDKKIIPITVEK